MTPFDFPVAGTSVPVTGRTKKENEVSALKRYNVKAGRYDTVLQLSDEDAKAQGLTDADLADAPKKAPAKKVAAGPAGPKKAATKKATPANKAREADDNKGA